MGFFGRLHQSMDQENVRPRLRELLNATDPEQFSINDSLSNETHREVINRLFDEGFYYKKSFSPLDSITGPEKIGKFLSRGYKVRLIRKIEDNGMINYMIYIYVGKVSS